MNKKKLMKKTILSIFVVGLAMASCKKDRTCTCSTTEVSSTTNGVTTPVSTDKQTSVQKITKVSKKGAACNSGEQTTTNSYTSGGTTYTTVDVTKMDCTLD